MKPKSTLRSFLLLAGSSLLAISSASAQSQWTNTTTGTQQWNTATNWDTDPTVPNGTGVTANLSVNLGVAQTVNLATAVTLGSLTFGDSATAFFAQTISGSAITFNNSGSGATLTQANTSSTAQTISNNIVLSDNLTIVNNGNTPGGNNAMTLSGLISGTGGLILNAGGSGSVYLSNTGNTYSGGVTFNHSSTSVVVGQIGQAFGTGIITFSGGGTVNTNTPGGGSYLLTTANTNVWNSGFGLNGPWNSNGNVTLGASVSVSRGSNFGLGGNIGETGGARSLTLTAAGNTVLNGTNNYTGGTTVSGGSLAFLKTASMPSTGNVSFANGTTLGIGLGGAGWTSTGTGAGTLAGIFDGANVGLGTGSSTLSYTTAVGLNLIVSGSHSFGVIENLGSGATAFTKSGIGTLTITGDNTYTGATTVTGGGGLILDYGSSDTSKFASAVALTLGGANRDTGSLGGGSITLKGGTFTEVVSATNLNAGHMAILRDGGVTSKLRMNAITRAGGSSISFADATIADTDRTNTNAILGGYATIGNDWAVNSTNAADGAIQALAAYDGAMPDTTGDATKNYTLSGTVALTAATAANTVKITDTGAGESLTLGAFNLTITSASATALGGIMYAGGVDGNYTIAGGGAGRIASSVANQELIFAVQTGTLTVNALIGGNSGITKSGAGTLVLGGTNTTNGAINVNQGVLRLNNAAASGAASPFGLLNNFVHSGAALELTGGFSFPADEMFYISGTGISDGGAFRSVSGANTWRAKIETGQDGARINNDSAGLFTIAQGIITAPGGDVTIGGTGDTTISTPTGQWSKQAITGGGGLVKDGAGTLTLSGPNNYAGNTTVSAGTLTLPDNASLKFNLGNASGVNNSLSGAGTVNLNGDFIIDTTTADSLSSGSWTLENVSTLTGPYGGTFTVIGFSDIGSDQWQKLVGGKTYTFDETTGILTLTSGGGPGPLDNFLISAISSPQTVGTAITGITLTARDASNVTVTSFTGTVNFGGTGGFTGTSGTFTAGVLTGVSVTPANAGSGLTFTVTDGVSGKTGTATITTIQTQYQAWAGGALFDADANNDGVKNGLAFLLGATSPTGAVTLPTVSHSAGNLVMNFNMLNAASRGSATIKVQQSSDLGISDAWVDSATVPNVAGVSPTVNGVSFNVTLGSPTNGVVATVAASEALPGTKLFGRLKAEQ